MENGVETKEETKNVVRVDHEPEVSEGDEVLENVETKTKTADGGISQLNLAEKVVQVFHEPKISDGDEVFENDNGEEEMKTPDGEVFENVDRPLAETETKTADGGISQLNVVDKVVHVFHERKASEGDEVFEEAIDDSHPEEVHPQEHSQKPDLGEDIVNGDGGLEKSGDLNSPDVNGNTNESHSAEHFEEAIEIDLACEDLNGEEEQSIVVAEMEPLVATEAEEEVRVTDRVVNGKDFLQEEQNDVVNSSNVEEDVKGVSSMAEDGETGPLIDVKEDVQEVTSIIRDGEIKPVIDVEEDVKEVSSTIEDGETRPSIKEDANGSCDVITHEKSENGDANESGHSHRNESSEQFLYKDEGGGEPKDNVDSVTASVSEEMDSPEIKKVMANFGASINEETEALEIKEVLSNLGASINEEEGLIEKEALHSVEDFRTVTDERVEAVAESDAEDGHKSRVDHAGQNNDEGRDSSAVVEEHETECKEEKESAVVKELGEANMDKDMKTRHAAMKLEVHEKQIVQEKQGPAIKVLGESSVAKETKAQPAVDPIPPPTRPAGLGRAAPLLDPARVPQQSRVNGAVQQQQTQIVEDPMNGEAEETDETREKLQMIRVKFLRLAHRLGQTPHNVVVAQVLYRLGLAEQLRGRNLSRPGAFSFDRASAMAEQLEAAGQEPLDFSCTIMVLGKTGVGKSATINSIFDEIKFGTDAFQVGTKKVQDVVGTVHGIKVRVIDTPGLLPCSSDQRQNEKILHSVKRFIKNNPPDIVLYLDRLDMQTRDFGDMPLLRTITEIFGPSIWFNAIVVLTHAASAPPEGPNGPSSYEMFVTQRSHVVQQAIRQAAGDMRLMNPVSLVENHSACRTNRAGQRVLPNGQVWKPHLLLLSFASKILAEANTLLKLQESPPGRTASRSRTPPLPFLLSSLLQSRAQVKLPEEQVGDEDGIEEDLDESSDSDDEHYDDLPPFKSLTNAQVGKLSKAQQKAYFDELEYREKLFMKKQLKEEKRRRKLLKKMEGSVKDLPKDYDENVEEESGGAASVPVAMPDFALPSSFDSDNPSHRYRFLDSPNQWLVRPVLETHGWDHDVGYEGINVERLFVVKDKIPLSFAGQVTKDKKESSLQMEVASSMKHGEGKATSLGFDMQTIGKDMAYTLRSDTRFSNFRRNKAAAGLSVTLLGDAVTAGAKIEDRLLVNKRFRLVMNGGAMYGRGDVAYGGSLEATLRDKDHPLGRTLSTLGLSIMDWHGDLAIGGNIQSQIPIGRTTNLIARANLNNRGTGQISIRLSTSEQLQLAMVGLLPLLRKLVNQYQQALHGE